MVLLLVLALSCKAEQVSTTPLTTPDSIVGLEKFFKISKDKDNQYVTTLLNKNGKIIHKEKSPKKPYVNILEKQIIQFTISLGSPNNYVYFYNIKTSDVSPVYHNPVLIGTGKIVFIKNDTLVVSHIFDKKKLYKEIKRDFSQTAAPSSAIIKAEFQEPDKILIKYFKGKEFEQVTEIINLGG